MILPDLFYAPVRRDLLKLTGKDRQSFLQGMVSNNVVALSPGTGCYAFMLDATAHVLADMYVLNVGDYLLLDLEPGMAPFVAETLEKYLIMEKCRITDVTDDYWTFVVAGLGSTDLVFECAGVDRDSWLEGNNVVRALGADSLGAIARVDVIVAKIASRTVPLYALYTQSTDPDQIIDMVTSLIGTELPDTVLDALRIEAGIPRYGVDIDKTVLAPEVRQDARAISYKKGCYIGQEIVARIDARGHTNKGLVGFYLDPTQPTLPEPGTVVLDGEKAVGRITSAAISPTLGVPIALGYLRNEQANPETALTAGAPDGPTVRFATLPFVAAVP